MVKVMELQSLVRKIFVTLIFCQLMEHGYHFHECVKFLIYLPRVACLLHLLLTVLVKYFMYSWGYLWDPAGARNTLLSS